MKYLFLPTVFLSLLFLQSCATTTTTTKRIVPKFTTVSKIVQLELGSNFKKVVEKLGSEPYDIYVKEKTQAIYVWYYKKIERKEDPDLLTKREGQTGGEELLQKQATVYCVFDGSGTLQMVVTDEGKLNITKESAVNKHLDTSKTTAIATGKNKTESTTKKGFFAKLFGKKKK